MPRVLLTGGTGLVGRHIRQRLQDTSWHVDAPTRSALDLTDPRAVRDRLKHDPPDVVVHAAGRVGGIQANIDDPVGFLVDNLDMGRNVLLAAHQAGVPRLLNLSSSCVYPRDAPNPLREGMILQGELEPTNEGYALAKIVTLRLGQYLTRAHPDRAYKTLIPCNLYGPFDTFDPERAHLVPAVLHKIHVAKQAGSPVVEVWGTGEARREFMYVADLADCVARALERFDSLPDVMNVGLGRDQSINDYYRIVADIVGYDGSFRHDLSKPEGMRQKLVDVSSCRAWGWEAKTDLREGIDRTYKHYLQLVGAPA